MVGATRRDTERLRIPEPKRLHDPHEHTAICPSRARVVVGIGLPAQDYGTHSLRRTKASIIYKATGNLRAVQILLGHAKIDSTVRYLGVDVEDALELAERTQVRTTHKQTFGAGLPLPTNRRLFFLSSIDRQHSGAELHVIYPAA